MSSTNVRKVNYLGKRKINTKARKCIYEDCEKALRKENRSGYCHKHQGIISSRANSKKHAEKYGSLNITKETFGLFKNYCNDQGYIISKKADLVLKAFLLKEKGESR
jgi:hypothetical protein